MADQASGSTPRPRRGDREESVSSRSTYSTRGRGGQRGRGRGGKDKGKTPVQTRDSSPDPLSQINERIDALRIEQRQAQEEFETRLLRQHQALLDTILESQRPRPTAGRDASDPTSSTIPAMQRRAEATRITGRVVQEELHPTVEKGVEFETDTELLRNDDGQEYPTTFRNPSVARSNLTYQGQPRLSKNVPEVDALDDGSSPTFIQWRASMRDKFWQNADHFASERSRCIYVWLKTKGLARAYLTPRYTSTNRQFRTVEEMLTCLETYFLTGTEEDEARNRFNNMRMQDKAHSQESFPEFKARFLADAIEGGVPESEWFYALWSKLPTRIRLQNATVKDSWKKNFSVMVQHLLRSEMERTSALNDQPPTKPALPPTVKKSTAIYKTSSPTTSTAASVSFQPRSSSTIRKFIQPTDRNTSRPPTSNLNRTTFNASSSAPTKERAKCYRCGEYGHFKSECPKPASVNELDEVQNDEDSVDDDTVVEAMDQELEGNGEA